MIHRRSWTFLTVAGVFVAATAAAKAPQTFTVDGQLFQVGSDEPLLDAHAKITAQILSADGQCILYEETHTDVNTRNSRGSFTLRIGSDPGDAKRSGQNSGNTMTEVFQNARAVTGVASPDGSCPGPHGPVAGTGRRLRLIVTPSATNTADTLTPDMLLDSVPNALVAETLDGATKADFLQVNTAAPADLSQSTLESLFNVTRLPALQALADGTSPLYMGRAANGGASLPSYTGNPSTPTAGSVWYDGASGQIKYYNGSVQTLGTAGAGITSLSTTADLTADGVAGGSLNGPGALGLANTGVTPGTYVKVTVDAKGRVTGAPALAPSDISTALTYTPVNRAGDTMTGALALPSNGLTVGTSQLTVAGGNVGIGTMAPSGLLNIEGVSGNLLNLTNSATSKFSVNSSGQVVSAGYVSAPTVYSPSFEQWSVGSSLTLGTRGPVNIGGNNYDILLNPAGTGNVGIGTTSPNQKLHVLGTVQLGQAGSMAYSDFRVVRNTGSADETSFLATQGPGNGVTTGYAILGSSNQGIGLVANSAASVTPDMVISKDGNVGIGTTAPAGKLDISEANWDKTALIVRHPGYGANAIRIEAPTWSIDSLPYYSNFAIVPPAATSGTPLSHTAGISLNSFYWDGSSSQQGGMLVHNRRTSASVRGYQLLFHATDSMGGKNLMVLNADGNVGIGTTSPLAQLHVASPSSANLYLDKATGNDYNHLMFLTGGLFRWAAVSSGAEGGSNTGANLIFNRYNDAGTLIDQVLTLHRATGNVGIGVTSPTQRLEVNGNIKATQLCLGADCRGTWPSGGTVTSVTAGTGLVTSPGAGITATGSIGIAAGGVGATELGTNAVTTAKISDGNVTGAKLETLAGLTAGAYGSATVVPSVTIDTKGRVTAISTNNIVGLLPTAAGVSGKFLKSNGTAWSGQDILFSDIKNSSGLSAFDTAACLANQTVKWSSLTDMFQCQDIGSLDATKITTGTLDIARLPTGAKFWQDGGSNKIYYNAGNVGIGTATPSNTLSLYQPTLITSIDTTTPTNSTMIRTGMGDQNIATGYGYYALLMNGIYGRGAMTALGPVAEGTNKDNGLALAFYTNGATNGTLVERMRISSTGNVGIGTDSAVRPLTVSSATVNAPNGLRIENAATTNKYEIWAGTSGNYDGYLKFGVNPADQNSFSMAILNSGMAMAGGKNITLSGTGILHSNDAGTNYGLSFNSGGYTSLGSGSYLSLRTGGATERVRVDAGGNVGIGTSAPVEKLHVNGALKVTGTSVSAMASSAGLDYAAGVTRILGWGPDTSTPAAFSFWQGSSDGSVYRTPFYIDTAGKIGIGTNAPTAVLDVSGQSWLRGTPYTVLPAGAGKGLLSLYDTTTDRGAVQAYDFASATPQILTLNPVGGPVSVGTPWPQVPFSVLGNNGGGFTAGFKTDELSNAIAFGIPNNVPTIQGFNALGTVSADLSLQYYGGNVGIGTNAPSYKLHVNGSVAGVGAYNALSDRKFKKDVAPLDDGLEKILQMRGVSFHWRQDEFPQYDFNKGNDIGFIAQEVEQVFPEAVSTDSQGTKSVAYSKIVAPLVESVKALFRRLTAVEDETAEMKRLADDQSREIAALKAAQAVKDAEMARIKAENDDIKARLLRLESRLPASTAPSR